MRPALYDAFHDIQKVGAGGTAATSVRRWEIVGPVCESGDFFARHHQLPSVAEGELLAILDAGAYGMALSSNYNSRPRAAEVLVDGTKVRLARRRETFRDLLAPEQR
jgi:diaminopimelate decarboxylase